MKKKLVSFPLYGKSPRYLNGIIENAKLMPSIYPGWIMRVYCEDNYDAYPLQKLGCEIVRMGKSNEHSGMLWRFIPAWEGGVDRVIFRDADSRINPRGAAAVVAWEQSGLNAHSMHDHEHHRPLPMLGGMSGVKGGILRFPTSILRWFGHMGRQFEDPSLLPAHFYPQIKDSVLHHSSVGIKWAYKPFPAHLPFDGFVGQIIDDEGKQVW